MTAKCVLFHNHRKRIVEGGTYNVLVHYVDVNASDLSGVAICNHFHIRYVLLYKNVSFSVMPGASWAYGIYECSI